MRQPLRLIASLSLVLAIAVPAASAQQAEKPASQSDASASDDAPFGDLLEGLEGIGDTDKDATDDGEDTTASDAEPDGNRKPTASDQAAPPLFTAQRAMSEAARLLAEDQLSAPTQSAQQRALDALDAFIEQSLAASEKNSPSDQQESQQQEADQQRQAKASSQEDEGQSEADGQQAETPGEQSGEAADQPGQAPEQAVDDVAGPLSQPMDQAVWGHLPERLRERLQATLPEEFLPAYEQAIRDYFTRLSEMSDADNQ